MLMETADFSVICQDKRTETVAKLLSDKGFHVTKSANILPANSKAVICPVPCKDESTLQKCIRKNQKVFGGSFSDEFIQSCSERNITCFDMQRDEGFAITNAIATAEGAIIEAMTRTSINMHMMPVLVLGFGRCGKVLCEKLKGLSCKVYVVSYDKNECSLASALGFCILEVKYLEKKIERFPIIFNTIPANILSKKAIDSLAKDCFIIDIATRSGLECDKIVKCPGLPSKYRSASSAEYIVDYILKNNFQ